MSEVLLSLEKKREQLDQRLQETGDFKLGCVFTQTSLDQEWWPIRDEHYTSYIGAIETAN